MRMVRVKRLGTGSPVWINPAHVVRIEPGWDDETDEWSEDKCVVVYAGGDRERIDQPMADVAAQIGSQLWT